MAREYGIIGSDGEVIGSSDIAKKVVDNNGGSGLVDQAVQKAKNPLISTFLKKVGIDSSVIEGAVNEIKGLSPKSQEIVQQVDSDNDLLNRLNKFR